MLKEVYIFGPNGPDNEPIQIHHQKKTLVLQDGVKELVRSMAFFLIKSKMDVSFERMIMPKFSVFYSTSNGYSIFLVANVAESTEKMRSLMNDVRSLFSRFHRGGKVTNTEIPGFEGDLKRILHETLKVVFIGESAVGKTTCRMLLMGEKLPVRHKPTIGTGFSKLEFEDDVIVWDSPGQEGFEVMWPDIVKAADVIAVVCDSKQESLDKAKEIVEQCREWEPRAKIMAIANKQDRPDALPAEMVSDYLGIPTIPLTAVERYEQIKLVEAIKTALMRDDE